MEVVISASGPPIKGAIHEYGVKKSLQALRNRVENRLPMLSLVESAGRLLNQANIFVPGGRGFRDLTERSKVRIPTVCMVFGSSTAGGHLPGMSDYTVMVAEQAQVFLAGPPLVKMATGRLWRKKPSVETPDERSGGLPRSREGTRLHRSRDCALNRVGEWPGPRARDAGAAGLDPRELYGIVSADPKIPFSAREVIARVVDGSRYEFRLMGRLVTGLRAFMAFRLA